MVQQLNQTYFLKGQNYIFHFVKKLTPKAINKTLKKVTIDNVLSF